VDRLSDVLKVWLPVLTTVGGGLWGLWLYFDHRKDGQRARLIESQKAFLELQLRLYSEVAVVAGK
jgi:hypothetical protein